MIVQFYQKILIQILSSIHRFVKYFSILLFYKAFINTDTISDQNIVVKNTKIYVNQNPLLTREYKFDGIFLDARNTDKFYLHAVLPILETVFQNHKDATLISYGPKFTGKSTLVGDVSNFYETRNIVNESIYYFFRLAEQNNIQMYFCDIILFLDMYKFHVLKYLLIQ